MFDESYFIVEDINPKNIGVVLFNKTKEIYETKDTVLIEKLLVLLDKFSFCSSDFGLEYMKSISIDKPINFDNKIKEEILEKFYFLGSVLLANMVNINALYCRCYLKQKEIPYLTSTDIIKEYSLLLNSVEDKDLQYYINLNFTQILKANKFLNLDFPYKNIDVPHFINSLLAFRIIDIEDAILACKDVIAPNKQLKYWLVENDGYINVL